MTDDAKTADARACLLRALDHLDGIVHEQNGTYVDGLVVVYSVRFPDQEDADGDTVITTNHGWDSTGLPHWQTVGLLRWVAQRIEYPKEDDA